MLRNVETETCNDTKWYKKWLTHSHMTPFDAPGKQAFWKHWEKEKLLVTSNFSFSRSVFYLFG